MKRLLLFCLGMLLLAGLFSCTQSNQQNGLTLSYTCNIYELKENQTLWKWDTILINSIPMYNMVLTAQECQDSLETPSPYSFVNCN